ncbi:hypothetical protein DYB34_011042 [Aphanomyces astaci]|uniref:Uncharacterized protein n=2 Tax=Aphanomyces astaci TaxID=112090 RepID=A0A397FER1_APHAT|nr:hypothetical protein DYB34_011042 [Aphanomyces astaci]RHZ18033.1 hypothetical protein DYB31_011011 [Aphanomyces astaci]
MAGPPPSDPRASSPLHRTDVLDGRLNKIESLLQSFPDRVSAAVEAMMASMNATVLRRLDAVERAVRDVPASVGSKVDTSNAAVLRRLERVEKAAAVLRRQVISNNLVIPHALAAKVDETDTEPEVVVGIQGFNTALKAFTEAITSTPRRVASTSTAALAPPAASAPNPSTTKHRRPPANTAATTPSKKPTNQPLTTKPIQRQSATGSRIPWSNQPAHSPSDDAQTQLAASSLGTGRPSHPKRTTRPVSSTPKPPTNSFLRAEVEDSRSSQQTTSTASPSLLQAALAINNSLGRDKMVLYATEDSPPRKPRQSKGPSGMKVSDIAALKQRQLKATISTSSHVPEQPKQGSSAGTNFPVAHQSPPPPPRFGSATLTRTPLASQHLASSANHPVTTSATASSNAPQAADPTGIAAHAEATTTTTHSHEASALSLDDSSTIVPDSEDAPEPNWQRTLEMSFSHLEQVHSQPTEPLAEPTPLLAASTPLKRKRGRPRKVPLTVLEPAPKKVKIAPLPPPTQPTKRPRGRPRKVLQRPHEIVILTDDSDVDDNATVSDGSVQI